MENLTHTLAGLAAAKAGLERVSPYATVTCLVAANLPDGDIVALAGGPSFYLEQHRGVSHSIVGTFVLAVLLPLAVWGLERLVARLRGREPAARLRGLLVCSLVVSATHPLLDWTNSYGIRPLLPWDGRWVYGDLVFIIDPWLWLLLGGACFLSASRTKWGLGAWAALGLLTTAALLFLPRRFGTGFPVAAYVVWFAGLCALAAARAFKLQARWGRAVPSAALALVVVYWGGLALVHRRALVVGRKAAGDLAAARGERVERLAAMPLLADPFEWRYAFETDRATWRFDFRVNSDALDEVQEAGVRNLVRIGKPAGREAELVRRAAADERARVLLDFARFPVARVQAGCAGDFLVQLSDLRFTEPGRDSRGGSFSLEVPVRP